MIVRADAFALPFAADRFGVIVADPPYSGRNRGKKGIHYRAVGYVPFRSREWWAEAWRVLQPSGHLYVFCAVRELGDWLRTIDEPTQDVLAWVALNNPAMAAYWRRKVGRRAPAWRPILHWQKPPIAPIRWAEISGELLEDGMGRPVKGTGYFVDPNCFVTSTIQGGMREALPWPNQLPMKLLRWLLRPHRGGGPVLDLFAGTGTTRTAAIELGMEVVSVELAEEAVAIARGRPAQTPLEGRP